MGITIIIIALMLLGSWLITLLPTSTRRDHESFVELTGTVSIVSLGFVAFWLVFGLPRGQSPAFSLIPLSLLGVIAGLIALRANKVYKSRYGSNPA